VRDGGCFRAGREGRTPQSGGDQETVCSAAGLQGPSRMGGPKEEGSFWVRGAHTGHKGGASGK